MAACVISCAISTIFIIAMIYFYNITDKTQIVQHYKEILSTDLKKRYEKITEERKRNSYYGYVLGLILSLFIIYYNIKIKRNKLNSLSLVCIVMATCFLTNYFYYILTPKTDWMLNHINNQEQVKAWLQMYRDMQFHYHLGIVFGIMAVGIFAFAFRCY
jgi:uncharacterized protein YacL